MNHSVLIHQISLWREYQQQWQVEGHRVALVATMGNLHEGHFSLVKMAQAQADKVVVSIFVNPLQFGPNEDYDRYPRTLDADVRALSELGVDVIFAPSVSEVYPLSLDAAIASDGFKLVPPSSLTDTLCGLSRPEHFTGVATVVLKLFNMIQPQLAVFGEKDYQQLTIIKRMVSALNLPIWIISAPTHRAEDGLALSSRNQYLSTKERIQAASLYRALQDVKQGLIAKTSIDYLINQATQDLLNRGFDAVDYLTVRHPLTLAPVSRLGVEGAVVLVAAQLGKTRLIDNLVVEGARLA